MDYDLNRISSFLVSPNKIWYTNQGNVNAAPMEMDLQWLATEAY